MNVTNPTAPVISSPKKDFQLWVIQSKLLSVSYTQVHMMKNATFCSLDVSSPLRTTTPPGSTIESFFIVFFWSPGFCIFFIKLYVIKQISKEYTTNNNTASSIYVDTAFEDENQTVILENESQKKKTNFPLLKLWIQFIPTKKHGIYNGTWHVHSKFHLEE